MKSILLISPPITKPCEPPAGIAKLARSLKNNGVDCRLYDAGIHGIEKMRGRPPSAEDTWTRRAVAHLSANVNALRTPDLYSNRDRYKRAVMDVNRVLFEAGRSHGVNLSLANYVSSTVSPVRSTDLIQSAESFSQNPFYPAFSQRLRNLFHERQPDIVGVSINFLSQALCAFAMIGYIRRQLPRVTILCGGGLVTSWMRIGKPTERFAGLVNDWISGPGEECLLRLCAGQPRDNGPVAGYDYSGFDMDAYLSPVPILPYAASRGCYWKKCAFCPESAEDSPYRTETPRIVGKDIVRSATDIHAGLIHFLDNALSPRFMEHLINHPPGVSWYGFTRITRHLTDPDFVRGLKASGCVMLKVGVESGDQRVLDALGKGVDVQVVEKALRVIHGAGIAIYVYLLFGTPAEDEESAKKTLTFTKRNAKYIDYLNLAIFNLPRESPDAEKLTTLDFYAGDLSLYSDFLHPKGWDRQRVRRFLSKQFKKQAAIRSILSNDPPFFTSNHAPFFHK